MTSPYICPTDNATLVIRPDERMTYEQRWCGTWHDCPQCGYSTLEMSEELRRVYQEAQTRPVQMTLPLPERKRRRASR